LSKLEQGFGWRAAERRYVLTDENVRPHQPAASLKDNIMLWLTTVAAFLGSLVAGVLALFLFSQRDHIREALITPAHKRMESRTLARIEVELLTTDAPFINEITLTENVSRYGARVVTKTQWRLSDDVDVKLHREGLSNRARIAYCKRLKGEAFAIGLQFSLPVVNWMV
jgi:hypothetical protein